MMGHMSRALQSDATAPGIALQHTLGGIQVQGSGGVEHAEGNVQPATQWSTAPYVPPARRQRDNPDRTLCSYEDCKAFPMKSTGYCAGHSNKLGLVDWPKGGAGEHKKKVTDDDSGSVETTGAAADGDHPS